jgi:Protein of unknown function (DUF2934)
MGRNRESKNHSPVSSPAASPAERQQQIAQRAYELHAARGYRPGYDLDDWLDAERAIADAA